MTFLSPRGIPLVCCAPLGRDDKILTVELYPKWYTLFLLTEEGVEAVMFPA